MAAQHPGTGQICATQYTMAAQGLKRKFGTARMKTAGAPQKWPNGILIDANQDDQWKNAPLVLHGSVSNDLELPHRQARKQLLQIGTQGGARLRIQLRTRRFGKAQYQIAFRQTITPMAENLARQTLEQIALHCAACKLLGNHQTNARRCLVRNVLSGRLRLIRCPIMQIEVFATQHATGRKNQ